MNRIAIRPQDYTHRAPSAMPELDLSRDLCIGPADVCSPAVRVACDVLGTFRGRGQPPELAAIWDDADDPASCRRWAAQGECHRNPEFMRARCCTSCLARRCMEIDARDAVAARARQEEVVAAGPAAANDPSLLSDEQLSAILARHPYDAERDPCGADATPEGETYGEASLQGMAVLRRALVVNGTFPTRACSIAADSVVYDVGSGLGRLALYLRLTTPARRVVGVEINRCRHRHAQAGAALRRLRQHGDAV